METNHESTLLMNNPLGEDEALEQEQHKYVIFRLHNDLYGSKLLDVREVVENLPTKKVPNTVHAFQGICNLRGQIIGVVDLRIRFDLPTEDSFLRPVLMVFESDTGAIAALVDQIVSVTEIPETHIEKKPNIVCAIPSQYIHGIGKFQNKLVTLIDIKTVLSHEDLLKVSQSKTFGNAA